MWTSVVKLLGVSLMLDAATAFTQFRVAEAKSYTAAVVEYAAAHQPDLPADQVLEMNAATYILYIAEASKNQVDIIVFPEGGLHGRGNQDTFVDIPSPSKGIAPCDYNSSFHPAVVTLSCGARLYSIYTVINIHEKYYNTTNNSTELYNSDVAFDRYGTVIGRYRKFNLYGEPLTKPSAPDHVYFDTDFGVRFGMFTCFDIAFYEPALALAVDYGIKHFVFPHCWISELPFLTALQAQWGWSYSLDVVLLAAGCNDPSSGGTGSGIYHGRRGALQTFQTTQHTSRLIISNVSTSFDCRNEDGENDQEETFVIYSEPSVWNSPPQGEVSVRMLEDHIVGKSDSSQKDGGQLEPQDDSNSSLWLLSDYLDVYTSYELPPPMTCNHCNKTVYRGNANVSVTVDSEMTLCQNNFCCIFQVRVTNTYSSTPPPGTDRADDFTLLTYRLVVFDGVRWYGGGLATGGVQVCGIVPCVNQSLSSCSLRANHPSRQSRSYVDATYGRMYQTSTVFESIVLTPTFMYNGTFVFPDILVTGSEDSFGQLVPSDWLTFDQFQADNGSVMCSLRTEVPISNLVTAAVYARQFNRDGQNRTEVSANSYRVKNPQNIFLFFGSIIILLQGIFAKSVCYCARFS